MIPHSRPWITEGDRAAVLACLESGMIARGDLVRQLERRLAETFGFADAVAVGSGCQALLLALRATGIGGGDRVALPTFVCPELLGVIAAACATPVLADVGPDYLLDDADACVETSRANAVILPSLFGRRARWNPRGRSALVIHDWAQYLPLSPSHDDVDIAILSFGATKVMTAAEGGAVMLRSTETADAVRRQMRLGESGFGLNLFPLSDLQAALAISQLDRVDEIGSRRIQLADAYVQAFGAIPGLSTVAFAAGDIPYRLAVRAEPELLARLGGLDAVLAEYERNGIAARRPVAVLLHHIVETDRSFPAADALYATTFSIPLYPSLSENEREWITDVTRKIFS
ncbi:MAG: DegT/DnrJ/EryC1/StrS family aminotransferase [Rhizobiaceae bacterium]